MSPKRVALHQRLKRAFEFSSRLLVCPSPTDKPRARRLASACALIFLLAFLVRFLHWQDRDPESGLGSLTHRYLNQGQQILDGEGMLFPRDFERPTNAQLLVHPPGYPIFVAIVFRLFGNSTNALTVAQLVADGIAAAMVTLIASELFPLGLSTLAGLLAAFSPHLSHYSLFLLPDSLSALPILIAIYLLVRSTKRPRLIAIVFAGILIGISCWLRANALLLAPVAAWVVWLLSDRGSRAKYSLAMLIASIITISPITIRNWVVFHRFIPLSLGAGITLIEGIGDYDDEKRFGMPISDRETKQKDIEWHNRSDYSGGLWTPDGIERDRYRFRRGFEVIRANPVWFAGVMVRRAAFMLRYNSSSSTGWPFDTARVSPVALSPTVGHRIPIDPGIRPAWTNSPEEFKASGIKLAAGAETKLSPDGQSLELAGDTSEFGDQISTSPIPVQPKTDYLLKLEARTVQGRAAVKVTSFDGRIALGSELMDVRERREKSDEANLEAEDSGTDERDQGLEIDIPFASGNNSAVILTISNNGAVREGLTPRTVVRIGGAQLFELGPTPHLWTRFVRPPVRAIQRDLYTTSRLLPLIIAGLVLLAIARRWQVLLLLLVVPVYYLAVQSAFHTEYRYILVIHYFLFTMAGVSIYCAGKLIGQGIRRAVAFAARPKTKARDAA